MLTLVSILVCSASLGRAVVSVAEKLRQQGGEPRARAADCHSADCDSGGTHNRVFMSKPLTSSEICVCCWRDCEEAEKEQAHQGEMRAAALARIAEPEDVDVWFFPGDGGKRTMYTPIYETVRHGLRNVASNFQNLIGFEDMRAGIAAAAAKGKKPLVFAVICFQSRDIAKTAANLKDLRDHGAYLVVYQTEPYSGPRGIASFLRRSHADEVWDYAMANVDSYPKDLRSRAHYVPPGYAPALEVNVNLRSDLRDESLIGYMGHWGLMKNMSGKYDTLFGKKLFYTNEIQTKDALQRYLEKYPIQLNAHRRQTCCPIEEHEKWDQHMEAFRFADLLSNKACVLSPPASDKDNEKWRSIVHIVNVEDTLTKFRELKDGNVTQCQLDSYERFKEELGAEKLIRDTGFFDRWSPNPQS